MRIVIDLQGAQSTGSRHRGIGRYTLSLTEAILRLATGRHEVILALNGAFAETIEPLRARFASLLSQERIQVWHGMRDVAELSEGQTAWRRRAGELLREAFLAQFQPDFVLVTSLFEGLIDDAITSVGLLSRVPTAAILYDLIPLIHRDPYLENPVTEGWYERKLQHARQCDLLLAISDSSRAEAMRYLGTPAQQVVSISTAAEPRFVPLTFAPAVRAAVARRCGISRPFIMYTGGIDHRKNIEGLIRAFALLPFELRAEYQLAIVCAANAQDRGRLQALAASTGLSADDVVFTGFVSEDDLLALYNLCTLFAFPSWYEGFGLPALEAMACGKPVIASNTSSLPEVVGLDEALFDPHVDHAIADKMAAVLTDPALRAKLARHGRERSKNFSWQITAERALRAMEIAHAERLPPGIAPLPFRRPRLAFVSPLQPERSGISDYNAELIPELARHYEIEFVTPQPETTDSWVRAHAQLRTPEWLLANAGRCDRVLYHIGNSQFHRHMLDLIARVPGVVVLHDFYIGHLIEHLHGAGVWAGDRLVSLYRQHGWSAVADARQPEGGDQATWRYPCNADVLRRALGVIVHSEASRNMARQWYGKDAAQDWQVVPFLRAAGPEPARQQARAALDLGDNDILVCSFGLLGPSKLSIRLIEAWLGSALARDPHCRLVLVGDNYPGAYGNDVSALIAKCEIPGQVKLTGWVDQVQYRQYLAAADVAVQLRLQSRGETSGAVFDCLNAGVATVVNRHGSLADLPPDAVVQLPEHFSNTDLVDALERLRNDTSARHALAAAGQRVVERSHRPRHCAELYASAIEGAYARGATGPAALAAAVASITPPPRDNAEWLVFAKLTAATLVPVPRQPQLLVDISVLAKVDAKTGIQRVVRALLQEWLVRPPPGYRVEPVRADDDGSYRYARRFTMRFLGGAGDGLADGRVDAHPGDRFVALDLNHGMLAGHVAFLDHLRLIGVSVHFVVYDLLPVTMPECFPPGTADAHQKWLAITARGDGVVCISRSVADEYLQWLRTFGPRRERGFDVDWVHLGADIESSKPSKGLPPDAALTLASLRATPSILMVGTIEPRKRHDLVLQTMERLWAKGRDVALVIVGKEGWRCDEVVLRLRQLGDRGPKVFWFANASDEWLQHLYGTCSGLVAASEGEGFGLSLVEAARFGLPALARDLPVFREVAVEGTEFFRCNNADELVQVLEPWLTRVAQDHARSPRSARATTWRECANELFERLSSATSYARWHHDGVYRYWGADPRIKTDVGEAQGTSLRTTGRAGQLTFGLFLPLAPGSYRLIVRGEAVRDGLDGAFLDVVCDATTRAVAVVRSDDWRTEGSTMIAEHFDVGHDCRDLELRLWVPASASVQVHSMEISLQQAEKSEVDGFGGAERSDSTSAESKAETSVP